MYIDDEIFRENAVCHITEKIPSGKNWNIYLRYAMYI